MQFENLAHFFFPLPPRSLPLLPLLLALFSLSPLPANAATDSTYPTYWPANVTRGFVASAWPGDVDPHASITRCAVCFGAAGKPLIVAALATENAPASGTGISVPSGSDDANGDGRADASTPCELTQGTRSGFVLLASRGDDDGGTAAGTPSQLYGNTTAWRRCLLTTGENNARVAIGGVAGPGADGSAALYAGYAVVVGHGQGLLDLGGGHKLTLGTTRSHFLFRVRCEDGVVTHSRVFTVDSTGYSFAPSALGGAIGWGAETNTLVHLLLAPRAGPVSTSGSGGSGSFSTGLVEAPSPDDDQEASSLLHVAVKLDDFSVQYWRAIPADTTDTGLVPKRVLPVPGLDQVIHVVQVVKLSTASSAITIGSDLFMWTTTSTAFGLLVRSSADTGVPQFAHAFSTSGDVVVHDAAIDTGASGQNRAYIIATFKHKSPEALDFGNPAADPSSRGYSNDDYSIAVLRYTPTSTTAGEFHEKAHVSLRARAFGDECAITAHAGRVYASLWYTQLGTPTQDPVDVHLSPDLTTHAIPRDYYATSTDTWPNAAAVLAEIDPVDMYLKWAGTLAGSTATRSSRGGLAVLSSQGDRFAMTGSALLAASKPDDLLGWFPVANPGMAEAKVPFLAVFDASAARVTRRDTGLDVSGDPNWGPGSDPRVLHKRIVVTGGSHVTFLRARPMYSFAGRGTLEVYDDNVRVHGPVTIEGETFADFPSPSASDSSAGVREFVVTMDVRNEGVVPTAKLTYVFTSYKKSVLDVQTYVRGQGVADKLITSSSSVEPVALPAGEVAPRIRIVIPEHTEPMTFTVTVSYLGEGGGTTTLTRTTSGTWDFDMPPVTMGSAASVRVRHTVVTPKGVNGTVQDNTWYVRRSVDATLTNITGSTGSGLVNFSPSVADYFFFVSYFTPSVAVTPICGVCTQGIRYSITTSSMTTQQSTPNYVNANLASGVATPTITIAPGNVVAFTIWPMSEDGASTVTGTVYRLMFAKPVAPLSNSTPPATPEPTVTPAPAPEPTPTPTPTPIEPSPNGSLCGLTVTGDDPEFSVVTALTGLGDGDVSQQRACLVPYTRFELDEDSKSFSFAPRCCKEGCSGWHWQPGPFENATTAIMKTIGPIAIEPGAEMHGTLWSYAGKGFTGNATCNIMVRRRSGDTRVSLATVRTYTPDGRTTSQFTAVDGATRAVAAESAASFRIAGTCASQICRGLNLTLSGTDTNYFLRSGQFSPLIQLPFGATTVRVQALYRNLQGSPVFNVTLVRMPLAPRIDAISPRVGSTRGGVPVTITGSSLGVSKGDIAGVDFGGVDASLGGERLYYAGSTRIVVMSPAAKAPGAVQVNIRLRTVEEAGTAVNTTITNTTLSSEVMFTYVESEAPALSPVVLGAEPRALPSSGGATLTIRGFRLGSESGDIAAVRVNGAHCQRVSWVTSTRIDCLTPPIKAQGFPVSGATITVELFSGGIGIGGDLVSVHHPPPDVTAVHPAVIARGSPTRVTLFGSHLSTDTVFAWEVAGGVPIFPLEDRTVSDRVCAEPAFVTADYVDPETGSRGNSSGVACTLGARGLPSATHVVLRPTCPEGRLLANGSVAAVSGTVAPESALLSGEALDVAADASAVAYGDICVPGCFLRVMCVQVESATEPSAEPNTTASTPTPTPTSTPTPTPTPTSTPTPTPNVTGGDDFRRRSASRLMRLRRFLPASWTHALRRTAKTRSSKRECAACASGWLQSSPTGEPMLCDAPAVSGSIIGDGPHITSEESGSEPVLAVIRLGGDPTTGSDGEPVTLAVGAGTPTLAKEVAVEPATVVLGRSNWREGVTVEITGVDDGLRDGNATVPIVAMVTDGPRRFLASPFIALGTVTVVDAGPRVGDVFPTTALAGTGGTVTLRGANFDRGVTVEIDAGTVVSVGHLVLPSASESDTATEDRAALEVATANVPPGYRRFTVRNLDGRFAALVVQPYYAANCVVPGMLELPDGTCIPCPTGGVCPGGPRLWSEPGYWNQGESSISVSSCDEPALERCLGGRYSECGTGYAGTLCGSCAPGYSSIASGKCVECPESSIRAVYILSAVTLWVVLGVSAALFRESRNVDALASAALILQAAGSIGRTVSAELPMHLLAVIELFGLFSASIDFYRPSCARRVTYAEVYFANLFYTMACVAFVVGCVLLRGFVIRRREARRRRVHWRSIQGVETTPTRDRAQRAALLAASVTYYSIVRHSLAMVHCVGTGEGQPRVLKAFPEQECWAGAHSLVGIVAFFVLVCVGIGCPICYHFIVVRRVPELVRDASVTIDDGTDTPVAVAGVAAHARAVSSAERTDALHTMFRQKYRALWIHEFALLFLLAVSETAMADYPAGQFFLMLPGYIGAAVAFIFLRPHRSAFDDASKAALCGAYAVTAFAAWVSHGAPASGVLAWVVLSIFLAVAGGTLLATIVNVSLSVAARQPELHVVDLGAREIVVKLDSRWAKDSTVDPSVEELRKLVPVGDGSDSDRGSFRGPSGESVAQLRYFASSAGHIAVFVEDTLGRVPEAVAAETPAGEPDEYVHVVGHESHAGPARSGRWVPMCHGCVLVSTSRRHALLRPAPGWELQVTDRSTPGLVHMWASRSGHAAADFEMEMDWNDLSDLGGVSPRAAYTEEISVATENDYVTDNVTMDNVTGNEYEYEYEYEWRTIDEK